MNRNAACASPTKSPELLAKYADSLLRKSNKANEEEDLEQSLVDTVSKIWRRFLLVSEPGLTYILLGDQMIVFKYIEDKDVFQKFYSRLLSKRLIMFSSSSDDAESNMITKLKDACGYEYTSKLQRMFQDMALCKDLNDQFKEKMTASHEPKDLELDFHILVLGTAAWPLQPPTSELKMPTELVKTYERFHGFYMNKHSGRKLTWLWQNTRIELRTTYTNQKYFFMTSAYQAAILLLFNAGSDSLTYDEILTGTGMQTTTLRPLIDLLTKQRVLDLKDDAYELNLGFKSKKIRINLNTPVKSEVKAESQDVMKTVDEDRKLLIQAVIVRVMKSRKQMKHQQLIAEAIEQLKSRFVPKVTDIKKAIDTLLDKECKHGWLSCPMREPSGPD